VASSESTLASFQLRGLDSTRFGSRKFRVILIFPVKSSAINWIDGKSFDPKILYCSRYCSRRFSLGVMFLIMHDGVTVTPLLAAWHRHGLAKTQIVIDPSTRCSLIWGKDDWTALKGNWGHWNPITPPQDMEVKDGRLHWTRGLDSLWFVSGLEWSKLVKLRGAYEVCMR